MRRASPVSVGGAAEMNPFWQIAELERPSAISRLTVDEPATAVVLTSSREAEDYGQRLTSCGARGFINKTDLSGESVAAVLRMS